MKLPLLSVLAPLAALASFAVAAEPPPSEVVVIDQAKVAATFAKGGPFLVNSSFKLQAGRRVTPGLVEIHDHDLDIFYIQEGKATLVTGGTAVDVTDTGPGEHRAKSITGGVARPLVKGDIIVIPPGVPHQYTEVDGTFLYFVIKVTQP